MWGMRKVIKEGQDGAPEKARKYIGYIWILFLVTWFLYPGAYLMPYLFGGLEPALVEAAVVGRHMTYTIADIGSKVIYGVLLTLTVQEFSKAEGYDWGAVEAG